MIQAGKRTSTGIAAVKADDSTFRRCIPAKGTQNFCRSGQEPHIGPLALVSMHTLRS
jgi:hypothetical protein